MISASVFAVERDTTCLAVQREKKGQAVYALSITSVWAIQREEREGSKQPQHQFGQLREIINPGSERSQHQCWQLREKRENQADDINEEEIGSSSIVQFLKGLIEKFLQNLYNPKLLPGPNLLFRQYLNNLDQQSYLPGLNGSIPSPCCSSGLVPQDLVDCADLLTGRVLKLAELLALGLWLLS